MKLNHAVDYRAISREICQQLFDCGSLPYSFLSVFVPSVRLQTDEYTRNDYDEIQRNRQPILGPNM
jgi:hypothetical protein